VKRKTFNDYSLFLEAWVYLYLAKLLIIFFPFKKIAALIGKSQTESPNEMIGNSQVYNIEIAVIRAVKFVFFSSKCYDQALATTFMLKRRKISSTIYFGIQKENEQLIAHAWVRCGEKIVSGRLGFERFTPIAWFGSHNLS
jgi:hypothetical protein